MEAGRHEGIAPAVTLAERAADAEVFLRGPSDWGEGGGRPFTGFGPVALLLGDAMNGEGPLGPPAPALDSPRRPMLRHIAVERLCLAGLHPLVAAVSAGQPEGLSIMTRLVHVQRLMVKTQSLGGGPARMALHDSSISR